MRKSHPKYQDPFEELRDSIKGDPSPEQLLELGKLIQAENKLLSLDEIPGKDREDEIFWDMD